MMRLIRSKNKTADGQDSPAGLQQIQECMMNK